MTVLPVPYSAVVTVATALWLGRSARELLRHANEQWRNDGAASHENSNDWASVVAMLLATAALLFLFVDIGRHRSVAGFWTRFWHQAFFDRSDSCYFLSSGFLWLQGLFYFRAFRESDAIKPVGIRLVFTVTGVVLLFFAGVQWRLGFPYYWTPGLQAPYEDIATFGIAASSCLVFFLTVLRKQPIRSMVLLGVTILLLATAVLASWSRGTWLATAVFLGVLMLLRSPRFVAWPIFAALLGTIAWLKLDPRLGLDSHGPFSFRLMALIRLQDSDRLNLYHKAWEMIQVHPWIGHGIGSFFRISPSYTISNDPYTDIPQLPHNILLQQAAEQGVPIALLFAGLAGWTLWRGFRSWFGFRKRKFSDFDRAGKAKTNALLTLALTLVFGAYLQANMTWDILLVHPTQPFFFWFLMAALLATIARVNASISGAGSPQLPKSTES